MNPVYAYCILVASKAPILVVSILTLGLYPGRFSNFECSQPGFTLLYLSIENDE